jgi:hypothetical protein
MVFLKRAFTVNKSQTVTIRGGADIIKARMQVRELARDSGFSTIGQARISMATSSLAYELGLGRTHQGQIVMGRVENGGRAAGLKVVCVKRRGARSEYSSEQLDDVRLMVDQLTVEELPSGDLQVTLVKWRI